MNNNALKYLRSCSIINLMAITSQKLAASFLALGLLAFAMLSIFGLGRMSGMTANENGDMAGCIFTGKAMLCKMNIVEHISLWQNAFAAMPQKSFILLALIILLVAVLFTAENSIGPLRLSRNDAPAQKLYVAQHPDLPLFNSLRGAFSQGVLNPKIYEFAIL